MHYVIAPADGLVGGLFRTGDHYRTLEALIDLGADLEAGDAKGRTPLAVAMLNAFGFGSNNAVVVFKKSPVAAASPRRR